MRVVLQRVRRASVTIDGVVVASIGPGSLLLVGFANGDDRAAVEWMAEKVVGLRIFRDPDQRMNLSLGDIAGDLLVVSQFTLYGDTRKGRRPSFVAAADPETAIPLYDAFVDVLRGIAPGRVETGEFGAAMDVELVNDGPVTLVLER